MHPFDVLRTFGPGGDPDRMPLPGVHSGLRSPAGPDATPKPHPPLSAPVRRSRHVARYIPPHLSRTGPPAVRDLRGIAGLTDLTEHRRVDSLTAARSLFAPELLQEAPDGA
jgi:hypothetical protein